MIDRNEQVTPFQKFYHLRSALTGKAARTIQSLDITEPNYSIAINILRDKFDCHRQICMRHWYALLYYPELAKETPEAIEDFIETFKINLKALEKLGDPLTSNNVIGDLITSKLPQSTVRQWYRTFPNKRVPDYTYLINFIQTRANGDQTNTPTPMIKGDSYQHPYHRRNAPRGHTLVNHHSKQDVGVSDVPRSTQN